MFHLSSVPLLQDRGLHGQSDEHPGNTTQIRLAPNLRYSDHISMVRIISSLILTSMGRDEPWTLHISSVWEPEEVS